MHATTQAAELLALEAIARRHGSGLAAADLQGVWQLQQIWPKGSSEPSAAAGLLLRTLAARLAITASESGWRISNAVNLGPLELCFHGSAELQGSRPLLLFWFERVELRLGSQQLFQRSLVQPPRQRLPFFALIARDPSGWLAARGRGGGLALWQLQAQG